KIMALWIGQEYLKSKSVINDNADFQILKPIIQAVQDLFIEPILGTKLYKQIDTQITNNTLTAANQTLLNDYILKCMLWYVMAESSKVFKFRYTNKGIVVKTGENSEAISTDDLKFIVDDWKNYAEVYAEKTINYIVQNESSYPEYSNNNGVDEILPKGSGFNSPFYLPDPFVKNWKDRKNAGNF
ncbi:hypothetical protein EB001_26480, partial [bacterium]|nr:hypothetical protein [bacterium]